MSGAAPCQETRFGRPTGRKNLRPRQEGAAGGDRGYDGARGSDEESVDQGKRDFLYIATAAFGAVGAVAAIAPLIGQLSPDAETIAAGAPIDVDLTPIADGQIIKCSGAPS